jgi:hypothetical protein
MGAVAGRSEENDETGFLGRCLDDGPSQQPQPGYQGDRRQAVISDD